MRAPRAASPVVTRLLRDRAAVLSLAYLVAIALVALLAPLLAPEDPFAQDLLHKHEGPSAEHWLGTDSFGRDVLSRTIVATRVTMWAAVQGVVIAVLVGVPAGLVAGYVGGWTDAVVSRVNDGLMTVPPLVLALAIVGVMGPGLTNAMIAVGAVIAPRLFRVARAAAHSARAELFVTASRAVGCSGWRVLWRHVLPNVSGPLLVQTSFAVGLVITAEASLSFLGLGVQPPTATWGRMTREAFATINLNSFTVFPPVVMVVTTVMATFVFADAFRDALGGGRDRRGLS